MLQGAPRRPAMRAWVRVWTRPAGAQQQAEIEGRLRRRTRSAQGLCSTCQLPFARRSTSEWTTPLGRVYAPTATQDPGAAQETELNLLPNRLGATGREVSDQPAPSHSSASGRRPPGPSLPTAAHQLGDGHETPSKELFEASGLGLATRCQRAPSNDSTAVSATLVPTARAPTAVQERPVGHDTACRSRSGPGAGDQWPSRNTSTRAGDEYSPTVRHSRAEEHEIESSQAWLKPVMPGATVQVPVAQLLGQRPLRGPEGLAGAVAAHRHAELLRWARDAREGRQPHWLPLRLRTAPDPGQGHPRPLRAVVPEGVTVVADNDATAGRAAGDGVPVARLVCRAKAMYRRRLPGNDDSKRPAEVPT